LSDHDLISLFEHDLFGKPVPAFPDHAANSATPQADCSPFSANLAPRAAKIKRQNRWFERYLKT
jgi:hypothetical protein